MELIKYLPSFYYGSSEVTNIQASIDLENDLLKASIKDLLDQVFVSSATWGLEHWEKYLGLAVDKNEKLENRRSRVLTRLRGQGTTTKDMIKNVCSSFSGGEVEILECYSAYSFKIKFVGTIGIPNNINYLASTIDEIKPAHLAYSFEYTFNTHRDLSVFTHNQLSAFTNQQLREQKII